MYFYFDSKTNEIRILGKVEKNKLIFLFYVIRKKNLHIFKDILPKSVDTGTVSTIPRHT